MSGGLRIAIVHFHYRRGGVTRVVENTVRALSEQGAHIVVLSGEPVDNELLAPYVVVVPGLAYSDAFDESEAEGLRTVLEDAAVARLGGSPDVWHVHNHGLGKNLNILPVLNVWSAAGENLLLQIHDFAEDGRPANFKRIREAGLASAMYPQAHYAVLNGRDRKVLEAAGCRSLHDLPNPIDALPVPDREVKARPGRILYLTRAIRRKNLGELIYWSLGAEEGQRFATSLAPENPAEQERYAAWEQFVEKHQLPVDLNYGGREDRSLEALLTEADALITTSVAEGFGLSFLEPWLVGLPVVGRDLPEITADFKRQGIGLAHLYEGLMVEPTDFNANEFRARRDAAWVEYNRAYGHELDGPAMNGGDASYASPASAFYDFGSLDEIAQREVICSKLEKGGRIDRSPLGFPSPAVILSNRERVQQEYNLGQYGRRLMKIYGEVISTAPRDQLSAGEVLNEFLHKKRFNMLRT